MRLFPQVSIKDTERSFSVPYNTLVGWKKYQTQEGNYRGGLYDKLAIITKLEKNTIKKVQSLFDENEMRALWGAFAKSTMLTMDLIEMRGALKMGFSDYCLYESMEASQFTDKDLEVFAKNVGEKLESLCEFEKYVLLLYLRSDEFQKKYFG